MADDDVKPKPARPRDTSQTRLPSLKQQVLRQAGKAGMRAQLVAEATSSRRSSAAAWGPACARAPASSRRAAGASSSKPATRASRRRPRRRSRAPRLHPARWRHPRGRAGQLYDANRDDADGTPSSSARSTTRTSSASWSRPRTAGASPTSSPSSAISWVRWSATLAPSSIGSRSIISTPATRIRHIVIRGKDDLGQDLVMARDYIGHGVRARAQGLITLRARTRNSARAACRNCAPKWIRSASPALIVRSWPNAKDSVLVLTADR